MVEKYCCNPFTEGLPDFFLGEVKSLPTSNRRLSSGEIASLFFLIFLGEGDVRELECELPPGDESPDERSPVRRFPSSTCMLQPFKIPSITEM